MRKMKIKVIGALAIGISVSMMASSALAEEWPMVEGDYWEVTGIDIKDGGSWKYINWLATEWRKNLEFSKSKGWIKGYKVFANVHNRSGEPDIYLIRIMDYIPSAAEGEKRTKEYLDWQSKSIEKMVGESGNRAEYREVMSTSLIQEFTFRE